MANLCPRAAEPRRNDHPGMNRFAPTSQPEPQPGGLSAIRRRLSAKRDTSGRRRERVGTLKGCQRAPFPAQNLSRLAPLQGAFVPAGFRGCRCAQSPANGCQASGLERAGCGATHRRGRKTMVPCMAATNAWIGASASWSAVAGHRFSPPDARRITVTLAGSTRSKRQLRSASPPQSKTLPRQLPSSLRGFAPSLFTP